MKLRKREYENFILNIQNLCPKYMKQIQDSLIVDEAGYNLGFFKEPIYTFSLKMEEVDYEKIRSYIGELRKNALKDGKFDEEKYSLFDDLSDFMLLLTQIIQENN